MQLARRSWPEGRLQLGLGIVTLVACGAGLHGAATREMTSVQPLDSTVTYRGASLRVPRGWHMVRISSNAGLSPGEAPYKLEPTAGSTSCGDVAPYMELWVDRGRGPHGVPIGLAVTYTGPWHEAPGAKLEVLLSNKLQTAPCPFANNVIEAVQWAVVPKFNIGITMDGYGPNTTKALALERSVVESMRSATQ